MLVKCCSKTAWPACSISYWGTFGNGHENEFRSLKKDLRRIKVRGRWLLARFVELHSKQFISDESTNMPEIYRLPCTTFTTLLFHACTEVVWSEGVEFDIPFITHNIFDFIYMRRRRVRSTNVITKSYLKRCSTPTSSASSAPISLGTCSNVLMGCVPSCTTAPSFQQKICSDTSNQRWPTPASSTNLCKSFQPAQDTRTTKLFRASLSQPFSKKSQPQL